MPFSHEPSAREEVSNSSFSIYGFEPSRTSTVIPPLFPASSTARMTVLPVLSAVTVPSSLTVATLSFSLSQRLTFLPSSRLAVSFADGFGLSLVAVREIFPKFPFSSSTETPLMLIPAVSESFLPESVVISKETLTFPGRSAVKRTCVPESSPMASAWFPSALKLQAAASPYPPETAKVALLLPSSGRTTV